MGTARRRGAVLLGTALVVGLSGCGGSGSPQGARSPDGSTPAPTAVSSPAEPATPTSSPSTGATTTPPCDPGGGFPRARAGCPDPDPETGWLSSHGDGLLRLEPFRTLTNDADGKAYAQQHGLDYPFDNDYLDAADGPARAFALGQDTVCTGIIRVDHQEPLADHVVDCADLTKASTRSPVPVAVWRDGATVVQVSELYRP